MSPEEISGMLVQVASPRISYRSGGSVLESRGGLVLASAEAEAWGAAQHEHGAGVQITPNGYASSGLPEEELIPAQPR
jgi:hypothetical protein